MHENGALPALLCSKSPPRVWRSSPELRSRERAIARAVRWPAALVESFRHFSVPRSHGMQHSVIAQHVACYPMSTFPR